MTQGEPNYRTACAWWDDLPNIWTPIGWKNHLFRFNVFWSGMILAKPNLNRRTEKYAGEGVQAAFYPSWSGKPSAVDFTTHEEGLASQGWADGPAPVLWTEWALDGVKLRQTVFAHIPGGGDTASGVEPLFAWVRVAIHDLCRGLPLEDRYGFILRLNAPHIRTSMSLRHNVRFELEQSKYPRALSPDRDQYDAATGWRLCEPDGRVRLAVAPGQDCAVEFRPQQQDGRDYDLFASMDCRKGRSVDLLLPMLPTERAVFDEELALGYAGALKQARRYWSPTPKTAARVAVPEPEINEVIRHSTRFSEILAEKDPDTGKVCKISGSLAYANLWATPGAMDLVMMMDMLGYHEVVARYLEIFREEQGTVVPPGPAYKEHPGYLSTPARYKSIDWLTDNGAVLYTLAMHGLLSGDADYIARFTDAIVKSCDWIRDARALRGHGGVEGLLPPAIATDRRTTIQAVWSLGWNYKGLIAAVRLLRQINHPRAAAFAREADDYRDAFARAYRRAYRKAPSWRDAAGKLRHLPPTSLAGDGRDETRHCFYLDAGPLFCVFAGLLDADDEIMESIRLWFREGPPRAFYRHDANFVQVPALEHEMSSAEPCYSWNVFHSWQQTDRANFLAGMYSLFAGALSRETYISCETRGGITGNVFASPLAIYLARLAVIDDEIRDGELHLLRLVPLAWLASGEEAVFERMPTVYGPVSLRLEMARNGKVLDVEFKPAFRNPPKKIFLHRPPVDGLKTLRVNGRRVAAAKMVAL